MPLPTVTALLGHYNFNVWLDRGGAEERMKQLQRLKDQRMLTDEEYRSKRKAILDNL